MNSVTEKTYWLGFSTFSGIGPLRFKLLLEHFGSAKNAWQASQKDLRDAGLGEKLTGKFDTFRNTFSLQEYTKQLDEKQVSFITLQDNNYPVLLKQIKNPPFVLYIKGDKEILSQRLENQDNKYIGVVGTRKITQYGREVTELLTSELVAAGFVIVSGLAIGVDAIAHQTSIKNDGKTIAVLGCGVDCCYPRENLSIYNSIIKGNGAIVSEFPLAAKPSIGSFPSRNRIIAGLSIGVLVTEGAEDSGALITAEDALENNRKVFAVPGPITSSLSKGPNKLLAKGAKLATSIQDITRELGIMNHEARVKKTKHIKGDSREEQIVIDLLQNESLHFDEIVRRTQTDATRIGTLLSLMEMKGIIKSLDAGMYGLQFGY